MKPTLDISWTTYVLMLGIHLSIGAISIALLTNSLYYLCAFFYICIFGKKQKGIVIRYIERKYYTKDKPRRLRIVFYPRISYIVNDAVMENTICTIKKPKEKKYYANEEINIIVNKYNNKQSVIYGDIRFGVRFIALIIGILYLYIMDVISVTIVKVIPMFTTLTNVAKFLLLLILISRMLLFIMKECLDKETVKKYCIQNIFIYCLIYILFVITQLANVG